MNKVFFSSLMLFRRDLRLEDNTALLHALQLSHAVLPIFIFDPRQIDKKNPYLSHPARSFMLESLAELEEQLQKNSSTLHYFYGPAEAVIEQLLQTKQFDALFFNRDYTPFSTTRDTTITNICASHGVACQSYDDLLLIGDPAKLLTKAQTPYQVFSAFFKAAQKQTLRQPIPLSADTRALSAQQKKFQTLQQITPPQNFVTKLKKRSRPSPLLQGGTTHAHALLVKLNQQKNYTTTRDAPEYSTTKLSAHNKFGTASIRQVAHAIATKLSPNHELIRQLYWRDFFLYLLFHHPNMLTKSARPQYETKPWNTNKKLFEAWCEGHTGIPIIDAGMRELNQTGYMHNRVRMLTASFLVKNLGIDWRKGAQYFAQKLVDYDPAVNAGNWQWVSSTGYDAQPYFRVFNPWIQQKKFDPECRYIKQWITELSSFTPAQIHNPKTNYADTYPSPLVDTTAQAKEYIALIKFRLQKYSD